MGRLGDLIRRLRKRGGASRPSPDESLEEPHAPSGSGAAMDPAEVEGGGDGRDGSGEAEGSPDDGSWRPLYWTEAMTYPPCVSGRDMTWREAYVVSDFLARLSLSVGERGALLTADALRRLAEDLTPARATAVLTEPWMVPVKAKASEATVLARAVADRALAEFGFERLSAAGLAGYPHLRTVAGFRAAVFGGDRSALKALSESLLLVHEPLSCTMATSIDYALACMGDRGAMARVADRLEALLAVTKGGEAFLHGEMADGILVAADTWRRLSVARILDRADGIDLAARSLAPLRIDLRRPWELRSLGLTMPPASKEARAAMERQGSPGDRSRAAGALERMLQAESRREKPVEDADDSGADGTGADEAPSPMVAVVLDGIGAGEGSSGVESAWGHLLEPLPVRPGPDPDMIYNTLQAEMPWLERANRKAALAAAIAARDPERCFRIPPMVLVGPPGVGKTRWARRVSELASVPMHSISLSGASSSKQVNGSERGWASARPSLPAFAFSSTRAANPLVLVDEVDKTTVGLNGDAVEALLPMLERETARRYPDAYLLGNLDLTRMSFVFTANALSPLSQPFLDRIDVVNVPKPRKRDLEAVALAMGREAAKKYLAGMPEEEEATEAACRAALEAIRTGGSLRSAAAKAEAAAAGFVWSPQGLRLVAGTDIRE